MTEDIITLTGLTKKFGRRVILSGVGLRIRKGDSVAFVGRNGCGKSTILKIIAGLLPFEQGNVTYSGKLRFGYAPDRFPAVNLTARAYISQIGAIAGLKKNDAEKRSAELFEALYMPDMADTPVRYLSKGTLQKMAVVQALLAEPDVLILDEPVSGHDAESRSAFIEMIKGLNAERGVTALYACHEAPMIKSLARSVYEIAGGKLREVNETE